jgi:hypothetical protein
MADQSKITPTSIVQARKLEASKKLQSKNLLSLKSFSSEDIQSSVPKSLQPQGTAKLPSLFLRQGEKLTALFIPSILALGKKFLPNIDFNNIPSPQDIAGNCPTQAELEDIIRQRNKAVDFLNNIGSKLDSLSITVDFGADFANLLQGLITLTKNIKTGLNTALKFIPIAPGAASSAITDLGDLTDTLTFKADGTPNLPPLTITAASVSPAVATVQRTILKCVDLLNQLDLLIKLCSPNSTLTDTSNSIKSTASNELLAQQSANNNTYKGFILDIETREYTNTVNQSRAVGKNKSEIILIFTEWSFASDPTVLIDELKFIIDRDDLKAY